QPPPQGSTRNTLRRPDSESPSPPRERRIPAPPIGRPYSPSTTHQSSSPLFVSSDGSDCCRTRLRCVPGDDLRDHFFDTLQIAYYIQAPDWDACNRADCALQLQAGP